MPTDRRPRRGEQETPRLQALRREWTTLVGRDMAGLASPHRLCGRVLTVVASGPAALELQHRSAGMIETINATMGRETVTSLRFLHGEPRHEPPRQEPPRQAA